LFVFNGLAVETGVRLSFTSRHSGHSQIFSAPTFDYQSTPCNSRQTIFISRISLQDVRITPLGTENNTKEGKKQGILVD